MSKLLQSTAKDQDCTVVVDAANASTSSASRASSDGGAPWASNGTHPTEAPTAVTATLPPTAAPKTSAPRSYYVDWLRVFLTLVVVLHHCVTAYLSSWAPWVTQQRKQDNALWLFVQLFVNGNQAYFMTLFFFISGLYVPGSYRRKGPWSFLYDRTLRLVLPCVVYSMLAAPFVVWYTRGADTTKPAPSFSEVAREWFSPTLPLQFNLATGPLWFNWMLWCFNAAYVVLRLMIDAGMRCWRRGPASQQLPKTAGSKSSPNNVEYTPRQWVIGGAVLITVLTTLCYATRILDYMVWNLKPAEFYRVGPLVAFMPDFFVVYVVAFGLGIFSGPAGWNVLARLPSGYAIWWLALGGIWWLQAGWLINVALFSFMAGQRGIMLFCLTNLVRTFVEQSFCVVWSAGLLVLFRQAFNVKPNWFGAQLIGAAYGTYIVHQIMITIFARIVMPIAAGFTSHLLTAAVISGPVVVSAWGFAMALRALPGAKRVL